MDKKQYTINYDSPIGPLTIASNGESITGLWMKDQKYYGAMLGEQTYEASLPIFDQTIDWLNRYFGGEKPELTLPLAPKGSEFRKEVWQILCEIPYGMVVTYGDIARKVVGKMGKATMSAQAVGGAVGHNPISIIIPCHRVVGTNGSLTGYAGGIEKKIKLLELETVDMREFFVPTKGTAL